MDRLREKKSQKREALLKAGLEFFLEHGVEVTSIDEIVKRAGVAKGTFYLYFKNKYELLEQVILEEGYRALREAFDFLEQRKARESLSPEDMLLSFTSYLIDYLAAHKSIAQLIRNHLSIGLFFMERFENPEIKQRVEQLLAAVTNVTLPERKARQVLYILVSMVGSICSDAILYGRPYTLDEIRPMLYTVILKMRQLNFAE